MESLLKQIICNFEQNLNKWYTLYRGAMDVLLILHGSNLENTMKKLIISILFGLFAFSAFAEIKTEPTGEYVDEFQIINIICGLIF